MALWLVGGHPFTTDHWTRNLLDMQIEGTKEAFAKMISERGISHRLGVDKRTVAGWKIYLKQGKSISLDKMEEMLIKAGATVAQEKVWDIVKPK